MMIPDEKLEYHAATFRRLAFLYQVMGVKFGTFDQYLQRKQGELKMRDLCINRHPLPLLARIRRACRRWFGKGKQYGS